MQACENPSQAPVWEDAEGDEYHNCPMRFISDASAEWYAEWQYMDAYKAARPYHEHSDRWRAALSYFVSQLNAWRSIMGKAYRKD